MSGIPNVDLREFLNDDKSTQEKFISEIGSAFEEIGFVALSGHFLSEALVAEEWCSMWYSLSFANSFAADL